MLELIRLIKHRKIKALFMAKTHNTFIQFFRYLFVGGFASVVDWGALWLFYDILGIWEYIAIALCLPALPRTKSTPQNSPCIL